MDVEVINVLPTGHRLQVRTFRHLGQDGVRVISDIVVGDGGESILLTAAEMEILCKWWLSQKEAQRD